MKSQASHLARSGSVACCEASPNAILRYGPAGAGEICATTNKAHPEVAGRSVARSRNSLSAFTIIEIALCLGIIGFALVAIIAVLPRGLNVQKHNREETIISQDATVWMNAIRNGARGYDDLTNYVITISNAWTTYNQDGTVNSSGFDWITPSSSSLGGGNFILTNGARIIGMLSIPKISSPLLWGRSGAYESNYITAYVRSMSGPEVDKPPQANGTILQDAFIYRMIVENYPYYTFNTNDFCMLCPATNVINADSQWIDRTNLAYSVWLLQTNLHDIRLRFRYPVLPNGEIPNYGMSTFRSMIGGQLTFTNDNGVPLYFIDPSVYAQLPATAKPITQ